MQFSDSIETADLGLFLKKQKVLVVSDFHIGLDESANSEGVMVPLSRYNETLERLKLIIEKISPKKIIINGDLKHEFGSISDKEWNETLYLLDFIRKQCKNIVLIKGNHDSILGPIAHEKNIKIKEYETINSILITHGHKIPKIEKKIKTIIIGHEHPAVSLKDGIKSEIFKCFLSGTYKKRQIIVIPSFNLISEGTDLTQHKVLSPFLKNADLGGYTVHIVSPEKTYSFGRLDSL